MKTAIKLILFLIVFLNIQIILFANCNNNKTGGDTDISIYADNKTDNNNNVRVIKISKSLDFVNDYTIKLGSTLLNMKPYFRKMYITRIDYDIQIKNSDKNQFVINNIVFKDEYINKIYYYQTLLDLNYWKFDIDIETNGISNMNYKIKIYHEIQLDWFLIVSCIGIIILGFCSIILCTWAHYRPQQQQKIEN